MTLNLVDTNILLHEEWRKIVVDYSVSGVQVHDARLVASMRVHGVKRILTFDKHGFDRYNDVEVVDPRYLSF